MKYQQIRPNVYNCSVCETRCDGVTVAQFDFEKDVYFSEKIENEVITLIHATYPNLIATKTVREGYPDIEIAKREKPDLIIGFVEIKGQARTFMSVSRILPQSGLQPSETLALNLSDLERYFVIKDKEKLPLYLVWCLMSRPCIVGKERENRLFFHQEIELLRKIRQNDTNDSRRFRRKSGHGDVVNGQHKGVVVNYHFSINELIPNLPMLENL
jgi:hypothetical protein